MHNVCPSSTMFEHFICSDTLPGQFWTIISEGNFRLWGYSCPSSSCLLYLLDCLDINCNKLFPVATQGSLPLATAMVPSQVTTLAVTTVASNELDTKLDTIVKIEYGKHLY